MQIFAGRNDSLIQQDAMKIKEQHRNEGGQQSGTGHRDSRLHFLCDRQTIVSLLQPPRTTYFIACQLQTIIAKVKGLF